MEGSPPRAVASPSQAELEVPQKYPLPPPPLYSSSSKVTALNWSKNKPSDNTSNDRFDELFKSEQDEDESHQLGLEATQNMVFDISEEDLKPNRESPNLTEAAGITVKLEDSGQNIELDIPAENLLTRPQKRMRIIMDYVDVPSVSWVISNRQAVKLEHVEREKQHMNPVWKVKVKKDGEFSFGLDTVFRRIDDLNIKEYPLTLDEGILNATVIREFISNTFGGNPQQTFPSISEENFKKHGYDDFMFLNLDYNPRAPQRAGFPGLFFQCSDTDLNAQWRAPQQRVFVRIASSMWLYVGQYSLIRAAGLTVAEWKTQSHSMMSTWSEKVCTQSWGERVRTRISLRKTLRREPTVQEVDQGLSKKFQTTSEEVVEAYNSGKESIGVWAMKCIGYDEAFQRDILEKFQHWVPKEKPAKGGKAQKRKRS